MPRLVALTINADGACGMPRLGIRLHVANVKLLRAATR